MGDKIFMNNDKKEGLTCPVNKAVELINKKWTIQIIRDMFFGKKHFKEFLEDKDGLSNKVLSNCLKEMEKNGLIEKRILKTSPITTEYYLTERGESMNKIIYELAMFTLYKCDYEEYKDETVKEEMKNNFKKACKIN
jgi:DNA-binding HxlR family transcriptional regulator